MALGAGDHAIIVGPSWPNVESTCRVTGAGVDFVRQRQMSSGWRLDMDDARAADGFRRFAPTVPAGAAFQPYFLTYSS